MAEPATKEGSKKLFLGLLHVVAGSTILLIWYGPSLGLLEKITALTVTLPVWTLAVAGVIEGSYWIGGIIPGQTYIGLYLLGHECGIAASGIAIFCTWIGVVAGLILSYVVASSIHKKKPEVPEMRPWQARKVCMRSLLALYPSAAATHMFERGYHTKTFLPSFIPIIVSGLIVLIAYVTILCSAKEAVQQGTKDFGLLFGSALIVWGIWRLTEGYRLIRR